MFPLQPTGFFTGSPLSTKPNAFTVSLPSGGGSSATNMANAYDNDPTTYGDLFCPGNPTVYSGPETDQTAVNFTHSPSSGIVATKYVTLNANVIAAWNVLSVTKGGAYYPNVYLQINVSGSFTDGTLVQFLFNNNYKNVVLVDGSVANSYLSKGLSYSGLFSGNFTNSIGPFTGSLAGKTLDVNSLTINAQWVFDSGFGSGKMSGSFDCKIYDLTYLYE